MNAHYINSHPHRSESKLRTEGLYKDFGATRALDRVDLDVRAGEFVTLLGPSGSGKSTLLQLICGLEQPSGGKLFIDGHDHTHSPASERDIGVVFQNYALFPHLSVEENVAFPLRIRRIAGGEAVRRAHEALEMVGLAGFHARMPAALSGGQQQRVALARCLVYQPSLILMDESFSALDRNLRLVMQDEVRRIHRETGATFVFVTHDQDEAMAMSDRICLMNGGRIEQIATPRELYDRPVSAFAANFIGNPTLLEGVVRGRGLETAAGIVPLPGDCAAHEGARGTMVFRPEHLRVGEAHESGLAGRVADVVFAGGEQRVVFTLGNSQMATIRAPADVAISPGQDAVLRPVPGAGHFIAHAAS